MCVHQQYPPHRSGHFRCWVIWEWGCGRAQIEGNITAVAQGRRTKEAVLQEAVDAFSASFQTAQQRQGMHLPCSLPMPTVALLALGGALRWQDDNVWQHLAFCERGWRGQGPVEPASNSSRPKQMT